MGIEFSGSCDSKRQLSSTFEKAVGKPYLRVRGRSVKPRPKRPSAAREGSGLRKKYDR